MSWRLSFRRWVLILWMCLSRLDHGKDYLPFRPGLVGESLHWSRSLLSPYKPKSWDITLRWFSDNDGMGKWLAERIGFGNGKTASNYRVSSIGTRCLTFKENCPDFRNTKVVDFIQT